MERFRELGWAELRRGLRSHCKSGLKYSQPGQTTRHGHDLILVPTRNLHMPQSEAGSCGSFSACSSGSRHAPWATRATATVTASSTHEAIEGRITSIWVCYREKEARQCLDRSVGLWMANMLVPCFGKQQLELT